MDFLRLYPRTFDLEEIDLGAPGGVCVLPRDRWGVRLLGASAAIDEHRTGPGRGAQASTRATECRFPGLAPDHPSDAYLLGLGGCSPRVAILRTRARSRIAGSGTRIEPGSDAAAGFAGATPS